MVARISEIFLYKESGIWGGGGGGGSAESVKKKFFTFLRG